MEQRIVSSPDSNQQVVIFSPQGRLDITTAWQFRLKLQECIEKTPPHIIVNLSQVNFIDSSCLPFMTVKRTLLAQRLNP